MRYEAIWYFEKDQLTIIREEELGNPRPLTTLHTLESVGNLGDATTEIEKLGYRLTSHWTLSGGGVPCSYAPLMPKD